MNKIISTVSLPIIISICILTNAEAAIMAKETQTLQKLQVNGTDREMGMGISKFPPCALKPKHKALGPEIVYVLKGEVTVEIDGQPTRVVHAGESYKLAAEDVHATQAGPRGAETIASWVTVPGKNFNVFVKVK